MWTERQSQNFDVCSQFIIKKGKIPFECFLDKEKNRQADKRTPLFKSHLGDYVSF